MRPSSVSTGRHIGPKSVVFLPCLAVILAVGVVATSCGSGGIYGGGGATTTAVSTSTTVGASTTAGASTTTSAPGTTAGGGAQVALQHIALDPTSVTIKAGESVTWTNKDGFAHHLVGDNGEFDSGDMAGGATFTFTFKTAGTVTYHCTIHPEMKGTIVVQ